MHASSRHGTPNLTSLPKDSRTSCLIIHLESHPSWCWSHKTKVNFSCLKRTDWEAWPPTPQKRNQRAKENKEFILFLVCIIYRISSNKHHPLSKCPSCIDLSIRLVPDTPFVGYVQAFNGRNQETPLAKLRSWTIVRRPIEDFLYIIQRSHPLPP